MQFNRYKVDAGDEDYGVFSHRGDIPEATDEQLAYLNTHASTLVIVTTWSDSRDHMVVVAHRPGDKRQHLLHALSNTCFVFTSVVLYMDGKQYMISDRQRALDWLGLVPRTVDEGRAFVDADNIEYVLDTAVAE